MTPEAEKQIITLLRNYRALLRCAGKHLPCGKCADYWVGKIMTCSTGEMFSLPCNRSEAQIAREITRVLKEMGSDR